MFKSPVYKAMFAVLFACAGLMHLNDAHAQNATRDQIRAIESEYARINNDREIPDDQLEYYLDRLNSGQTITQISREMDSVRRAKAGNPWRPQTGWVARELICTSINNRYRECAAPFHGRAVVTYQISQSSCIEDQSWGQKQGMIWVDRGCRARFGMVVGGGGSGNGPGPVGGMSHGNRALLSCQSKRGGYKECATGIRGRVELVNSLGNSANCIEHRTWGQRAGTVWVTRGCRAEFASDGRPGPRDDGNWNSGYAVTCTSHRGNRGECEWDRRYGRPRLAESYSRNTCIEGNSWGYDNGFLWVDDGCRARFVSARTSFGR